MILADVPVVPDAPDARELLINELSKPEYTAAQPTLFDRVAEAFFDWLGRVFTPETSVPSDWLLVGIVGLLVAGIIVAFVVWGVPRLNRRTGFVDGGLFGSDDRRSAAELRRSAADAAAAGDLNRAVLEQYRALARGLDERTLVTVAPGTTAHSFASHAATTFPAFTDSLRQSSDLFDAVRYLDGSATADDFARLRALDAALEKTTPDSVSADPLEAR